MDPNIIVLGEASLGVLAEVEAIMAAHRANPPQVEMIDGQPTFMGIPLAPPPAPPQPEAG